MRAKSMNPDSRLRCAELFRQYHDAFLRWAYRHLHNETDAADIVQHAYLRMMTLPQLPAVTNLRAYLYVVISRLCTDRINDDKRVRSCRPILKEESSAAPDQAVELAEVHRVLNDALQNLTAQRRMAYALVELRGHSVRDAAKLMGLSEPAVYQLAHRAQADLARALVSAGWSP